MKHIQMYSFISFAGSFDAEVLVVQAKNKNQNKLALCLICISHVREGGMTDVSAPRERRSVQRRPQSAESGTAAVVAPPVDSKAPLQCSI